MRAAIQSLVNYQNPRSIGSRLRGGRFVHVEHLVATVLKEKSICEIVDIGGVARYWHLMNPSLLRSCRVTIVNLEEPWGVDPRTDTPEIGQFEFAVGDGRSLQFDDGQFDIAHSNSVLEHVGSYADMQRFVRESARVARFFYIQTPYFWFPIEPHFGFPFIHWLPAPLRCKIITRVGVGFRRRFRSVPDAMAYIEGINLIDIEQARALPENSRIVYERVLRIPKSLMLIRNDAATDPPVPARSVEDPPRRGTAVRTFAANLGLVMLSLLVGALVLFGIGEAYFQIRFASLNPDAERRAYLEYHATRGWQMEPGDYLEYEPRTNRTVHISINDLGLRGSDIAREPPRNTERISVIGDSFVFAATLPQDKTFTDLLEKRLGAPYEVLNLAVPGYGTGQQYLLLERLLAQGYDLGELVLVFFTNDLQDNIGLNYSSLQRNPHRPSFIVNGQGELVWQAPRPPTERSGTDGLLDRSYFLSFVRATGETLVLKYPVLFRLLDALGLTPELPRIPGVIAGWYTPGWEARWEVTREVLDFVVRDLEVEGLADELTIVFMPSPFQTEAAFRDLIASRADEDPRYAAFLRDTNRPQRVLAEFCKEEGIRFVDLTPALARVTGAYFPREGHLTELGSAVVAGALETALAEDDAEAAPQYR
jgi:hypothetical protein